MRNAGLSIEVIIEYIRLFNLGDETIPQRLQLLIEQREKLRAQKKAVEDMLERLDYKISRYELAVKTGVLSWEEEDKKC